MACALLPGDDSEEVTPTVTVEVAEPTSSPTLTPTPIPGGAGLSTPVPSSSRCDGLGGEIEVQVLVGPASAVGMEPFAVGSIPFSVVTAKAPYAVQGEGDISYADVLTEKWGTYEVALDLHITVAGECVGESGGEELHLTLEMAGEQMVEVKAEGFHGEYPWSGSHSVDVRFPLAEGASVEGEGWAFVLHLQGQ
jgi:hypothetical protein